MKFIKRFLHEKNGKIVFSYEEVEIFEEDKIFQKIDGENLFLSKDFELYLTKLQRFSNLDICIKEGYFKNIHLEISKDEVSEENLEKYIEYEIKEILNENDLNSLDDYFIKYFKIDDIKMEKEIYSVYILQREFVEDLVEYSLKNRLKIGKIVLDENQNFFIDNYDLLLHKNSDISISKKEILVILTIFLIFAGIKIYNSSLKNEILKIEKKIAVSENRLNENKEEMNRLQEEILQIKEDIENLDMPKEYIGEKILRILKMMPESMIAEKIYYEKGFLNIKGNGVAETALFDFLKYLEKDSRVISAKYDYIIKKDMGYEFALEVRV